MDIQAAGSHTTCQKDEMKPNTQIEVGNLGEGIVTIADTGEKTHTIESDLKPEEKGSAIR